MCRGGGHLLVSRVPVREQKTAKLTLNSVFEILNLIPLFTILSLKCNPFHCVQSKNNLFDCNPLNAYSFTSATIVCC